MPIFSPDNRWIAFTKKTPPPPDPPAESPFEKQLDQRFKGQDYDWMNIRYDSAAICPILAIRTRRRLPSCTWWRAKAARRSS